MPSGTVVADLPGSVQRVWDIISDLENAPSWVPDLISVKRLDSGSIGVGSRFEQVARVQAREMKLIVTIKEFDSPRLISHTGEGGSVKIGGRTTITETASGCTVTNEWNLELSGLLKLASPIAGNWTQNNIETSMKALRALLEGENAG